MGRMTRENASTSVTDFSPQEQTRIHQAACAPVEHAATDRPCDADRLLAGLADRPVADLYVSLKRGNTLRGCCGVQGSSIPLARALAEAAFRTAQQEIPASWLQLTIRGGLPLQSTLFQMTEHAARALASSANPSDWPVDLAILSSIVHHGTGDDCELAGIQCEGRALIAMDGRRWSIAFDQDSDLTQLLETTLAAESFHASGTLVFSAHCDATETRFAFSTGPRPQSTIARRVPAWLDMLAFFSDLPASRH
jgi:hypothetical protein